MSIQTISIIFATILFTLMSCFTNTFATVFVKHELSDYPLALCNDGTRANYHMEENCNEKDKMMIYLQGGGFCVPGYNCDNRCGGGNALCTAEPKEYINKNQAIFSNNSEENVATHDFCKVYVHYCSSDLYSGAQEPTPTNDNYYYHGFYIIDAIFEELLPKLKEQSQVVFIGVSAGALGVNRNCDFVADKIHAQNQFVDVRCVVDSAADYAPYEGIPEWCESPLMWHTLLNEEINAHGDESCYVAMGDHSFICSPYVTYFPFVRTPMFNVISMWDTTVAPIASCHAHEAGVDSNFCHKWRTGLANFARQVVSMKKNDGAFLLNCPIHCLSGSTNRFNTMLVQSEPDDNGNTMNLTYSRAIANWLQDTPPFVAIDNPDEPNNFCA